MAFLNLSSLPEARFEKSQNLNERFSGPKRYKVFLSYRHADRQYVAKVVNFLQNIDRAIYVDYLDQELYSTPGTDTAPILRKRIEQSEKLIQLITPNSPGSKWMPWEIGLGDGILGFYNTITLPAITNQSRNFDQEYLNMYGYIDRRLSRDESIEDWAVHFPEGKAVWFKEWIKQ